MTRPPHRFYALWGHNFGTDSPNDLIFWLRSEHQNLWPPYFLKKLILTNRFSVCVCIVFGPFPQRINGKSVKLAVWAVSLNFLFDFTLFVIDIHQIMLISLFPTPFDHFHFHRSGGLILWYDFRLWHMCCFYWPMLQEKHHLQLKFQKNIMKRPYEQLVIYVCGGGVFEVSSTLKTTISIILLKWVLFWVSWKTTNQEKSQIISFLVII